MAEDMRQADAQANSAAFAQQPADASTVQANVQSASGCATRPARKPCCRRRGGGGGALVEPAVLAALLCADGYGYDLRRSILEMSEGAVDADAGGLYRTLRRLEDDGSVTSRWCEEGAGPKRREYELTAHGVDLARQWVEALRAREQLDRVLASMLEHGLAHSAARPQAESDEPTPEHP